MLAGSVPGDMHHGVCQRNASLSLSFSISLSLILPFSHSLFLPRFQVTSDYFVFASLGDSRAILASNDEVVFSTKDHKPGDQRERKRIYDAGGYHSSG